MKKIRMFYVFVLLFSLCFCHFSPSFAAKAAENDYFYSQLSSFEKSVYQTLKSKLLTDGALPEKIEVVLSTPIVGEATDGIPNEQQSQRIIRDMMESVMPNLQAALDALLADHPSIFYLDLTSESAADPSCGFSISAECVPAAGGKYVFKATALSMSVVVKEPYKDHLADYRAKLKGYLDGFFPSGSTRYEKVRSIHDFVCERTSYDKDFNDSMAYDALGVFETGHQTVCEGYAKAVKLLCDRADIPCVLVTGVGVSSSSAERHMWNVVQMEDGSWYGLDATWDDQASGIQSDFFLTGSTTLPSAGFPQRTFSDSHRPDGDLSGVDAKVFSYPSLALTAYAPYQGIIVKTAPTKLTYTTEDKAVDLSGLVLQLVTADGLGPEITAGFAADAVNFQTAGEQEVTVRYGGFSAKYTVTVSEAQVDGEESEEKRDQNEEGPDPDKTEDTSDTPEENGPQQGPDKENDPNEGGQQPEKEEPITDQNGEKDENGKDSEGNGKKPSEFPWEIAVCAAAGVCAIAVAVIVLQRKRKG